MGNRFFSTEGEPTELPRRVYARVERVDPEAPDPGEPVTIFFDCVSADWIDQAPNEFDVQQAPLSVISLHVARATALPPQIEPVEDPRWLELSVGDQRTPLPIRHYGRLFDNGVGRFLEKVQHVPHELSFRLDRHASMDDIPDARVADIEQVLLRLPMIEAAAVYDVGQGNCTALLSSGFPALYFDFGGGVLNNTKTFPDALKRFCLSQRPTVVLSHLDWDHWSSAQRFPAVLEQPWIIPRQDTSGLIHRAFLANILAQGQLLIWPLQLPSVAAHQVRIERCTGRGRNHSGLALVAIDPRSSDTMLFPGDAKYSAVPSATAQRHVAVVVPHHGGDIRNRIQPYRAGNPDDRAVFSYGANNSYRHPAEASETMHRDWPIWLDTSIRSRSFSQSEDVPAHVGLFWRHCGPSCLELPCGG